MLRKLHLLMRIWIIFPNLLSMMVMQAYTMDSDGDITTSNDTLSLIRITKNTIITMRINILLPGFMFRNLKVKNHSLRLTVILFITLLEIRLFQCLAVPLFLMVISKL